jgi:uncharacterized protein (TIGR02453 family)
MKYFTREYIQFFEELEKNNNKEWFHSNKKRYNKHVKEPLMQFVTDVITELQKLDPQIDIDPKKCIKRINKDVRFSKDKTPYKMRSFVHIYKGDKMDPITAVAFQMGAKNMGIMNGYYMPTAERLQHIRDKIQSDPEDLKSCIRQVILPKSTARFEAKRISESRHNIRKRLKTNHLLQINNFTL